MKKSTIGAIAFLSLTACTDNVTPTPVGGSRADGTVVEAFQFGAFDKPVVDWATADADAKERCHAWGYTNAERFAGLQKICQERNGYGMCMQTEVHVTYQCTGPAAGQ